MRFVDDDLAVRTFVPEDAEYLAEMANNPKVSAGLADRFPSPYGMIEAVQWINLVSQESPKHNFAIEYQSRLVGGIGFEPLADVHSKTAAIGYWLGEAFWGRGLAARAVKLILPYGFDTLGYIRIQGLVFADNSASMRVLEKSGFVREGVMRRHVVKRGVVHDAVLYALVKENADKG